MKDIHVHYGQFRGELYPPEQVIADLRTIGVDQIGLMPSISKTGDNVLDSHRIMVELISKYRDFIIPILWIHPSTGLATINQILKELPYKIIKIHGYFHDWHKCPNKLQKVIAIAKEKNLPIMFHTGGRKESYAFSFKKICKNNPDNIFILAHSRPVKGTINILRNCSNVYCDTAFVPMNDLKLVINSGLEDRILFGTDYPIINAFEGFQQDKLLYIKIISKLRSAVSEKIFKKITEDNFKNILR
jgi:predicted TIM-barrel fold metal-dependent hydrolase